MGVEDHRWIVVCEAPFLEGNDGGRREHLGMVRALGDAERIGCLVICGSSREEETDYSHLIDGVPVLTVPRRSGLLAHLSAREPYVWTSRRPTAEFWERLMALDQSATGVLAASFKSAGLAQTVALSRGLPLVIRQHNLEDEYHRDLGRASRGPRALYYKFESKRIRRAERRLLRSPNVVGIAEISPIDQQRRSTANQSTTSRLVPPFAIEPPAVEPGSTAPRDARSVVYLGALDIAINQDGLRWFFGEVWPLVLELRPSARITIAGRRPDASFRAYLHAQPSTDTVYDVSDPAALLSRSMIAVNPAVSGSGVNIKLVEYLANGCAVLTTRRAADTLPPFCEGAMIVASTSHEFAASLIELFDDPHVAVHIGQTGQAEVAKLFDWRALVGELDSLMNASGGS